MAHLILSMVAPDDAVMEQIPGTGIQHANGQCSVGFCGRIFLRPVDVSFRNIQFSEGEGIAIAAATIAVSMGPPIAPANPRHNPIPVGGGNSTTGSKVLGVDNAAQTNGPPFALGVLLLADHLAVPRRQFQLGTVYGSQSIGHRGRDRPRDDLQKGSTPVSAVAADPTNIVNCAAATP